MKDKLKSYQTVDTLGKSSADLVVKVYDGAISDLNKAIKHYQKNKIPQGYEALEKAKKFIVHLYTTLDEEKGGDIAQKLSQLYAFIIEQLNIAQTMRNLSAIEDSVVILSNLREGWMQLAEGHGNKVDRPGRGLGEEQDPKNLSLSI